MGRIILGLGGRATALKADARPDGLTVPGCHGDKFHEVERDVFIAAGAQGQSGGFLHKSRPPRIGGHFAVPPKADDIRLAAPIHPAAIHTARLAPHTARSSYPTSTSP